MINIAVDAMGGDNAPSVVVEGAVRAANESGGKFIITLCGPEEVVHSELAKNSYMGESIVVHNAPQLVNMDEQPTEVLKNKQNSGLVQCVYLQKAGKASASISAGNSGAMMATCLMVLGRVGGISRPAIACPIPTYEKEVILLDCGGNVDEKPLHLLHFAICGSVYAESVFGRKSPTVGLLNIGEEEKKGPELCQEAYKILKSAPINFIGNVEGRDIPLGTADVIVAPGYTGNVMLKLMEGFYELHKKLFGKIDTAAGEWFHQNWNYSKKGGALLLGLNGTGIITHGRAESITIQNAIHTAFQLVESRIAEKIGRKLEELN